MRHKAVHIEHCQKQAAELRQNIVSYQEGLQQHIADLEALVRSHLWVTSDFVEPASAALRRTQEQVGKLLARVAKIEAGIDALPCEAAVSSP